MWLLDRNLWIFPMSKIAKSLERAQLYVVIYRDFRKQSRNIYSDAIEQVLWCWFKIRSSCARPDAAVFGLYVYLCAVQS